MNLLVEKLKQLPQKKDEIWQGGLFRTPMWVAEEGEKPYRPWMGGWVSLRTKLVNMGTPEQDRNLEAALTSLVDFACNVQLAGYRPGGLDVKDAEVAEYLGDLLGDADIVVEQRDRLHTFDSVLEDMLEIVDGGCKIPNALANKKVTVEMMRRFAEASCEFYHAAPWRHLLPDDLIEVESPLGEDGMRYLSVLGSGGDAYGLGFYNSPSEFELFLEGEGPEVLGREAHWTVLFDPIMELPLGDADLWEDHEFPVACEDAYPLIARYGPGAKVRRPGPEILAFAEGLLRALGRTTETEMDAGHWCKRVETFEGEQEYVLSLPDCIDDEDDDAVTGVKLPDMRSREGTLANVKRLIEAQDFESEEEMNEFLNTQIIGKDLGRQSPETPAQEAQELIYEAFEASGRKQLKLINRALEICPDCADAYVLLAERSANAEEARDYYEQSVAAGERALGEKVFAEDAGHFWGILETRPYMRARFGLAESMEHLGFLEEAAEHYREMLYLNPNDNQGVRDTLLPLLVRLNADDEAESLLKRYADDKVFAVWNYAAVLLGYRREGDTPAVRKQLEKAIKVNGYVLGYLLGDEDMPWGMPDSYSPGSAEEAVHCVSLLEEAWEETEGAIEWLESSA